MTPRRELLAVLALCALGAVLVLLAAGRVWAVASQQLPGLPLAQTSLRGGDAAPGLSALGVVALAGPAALLATRGRGRPVLGLALSLAGAATVALSLHGLGGRARVAAALADRGPASMQASGSAWPWVALLGGSLIGLAGLLTVARGRAWPGLSGRYDSPVGAASGTAAADPAGAPSESARERSMWDALDRGEDPTR